MENLATCNLEKQKKANADGFKNSLGLLGWAKFRRFSQLKQGKIFQIWGMCCQQNCERSHQLPSLCTLCCVLNDCVSNKQISNLALTPKDRERDKFDIIYTVPINDVSIFYKKFYLEFGQFLSGDLRYSTVYLLGIFVFY